jgi:hypothetical protein
MSTIERLRRELRFGLDTAMESRYDDLGTSQSRATLHPSGKPTGSCAAS